MTAAHSRATAKPAGMRRMLWRMLPERGLTVSMVAGLGGDRELSADEKQRLAVLLARREGEIFSDLVFTLTHQWFTPQKAKELWQAILKHKYEISAILGRNVRITVAAVDYLYNILGSDSVPAVVAEQSMWEMAEVAMRDSLTRLYDLPTLCMHLDAEVNRQRRYGTPVSVIIGDVDNFKALNDKWGHQRGDRVLRRIAEVIAECARDVDICARWGGEEFAVLVAQSGREGAVAMAERIRSRIEASFHSPSVTVSEGVSSCPDDANSSEGLIAKADQAMYWAKQAGKNRVAAFGDIAAAVASARRSGDGQSATQRP